MKYVVITFWALVLGQVVGYIVASLSGVSQIPFVPMIFLSLFIELIVLAIVEIGVGNEQVVVPVKQEKE